MPLFVLPRGEVQIVALDAVGNRCLDGVVAEGNQIIIRLAIVGFGRAPGRRRSRCEVLIDHHRSIRRRIAVVGISASIVAAVVPAVTIGPVRVVGVRIVGVAVTIVVADGPAKACSPTRPSPAAVTEAPIGPAEAESEPAKPVESTAAIEATVESASVEGSAAVTASHADARAAHSATDGTSTIGAAAESAGSSAN